MLDSQLSWALVYSVLNYSGPQSVIINRLHSTSGAYCRAEKRDSFCSEKLAARPVTSHKWGRGSGETRWKNYHKGNGKGGCPGWVGRFLKVAVVEDKSCWGAGVMEGWGRCWKLLKEKKKKKRTGGDFHLLDYMGSNALLLRIMPSFSSVVWWIWSFKT